MDLWEVEAKNDLENNTRRSTGDARYESANLGVAPGFVAAGLDL